MWKQDSSIWGGKDYLDQTNYFSNEIDEFIKRKFPTIEKEPSQDSSNTGD